MSILRVSISIDSRDGRVRLATFSSAEKLCCSLDMGAYLGENASRVVWILPRFYVMVRFG